MPDLITTPDITLDLFLPVLKLFFIALFFVLAWLWHKVAYRIAGHLLSIRRFSNLTSEMRSRRLTTLNGLLANMISFFAFLIAIIASLSLFIPGTTLVWLIGLFSAAFGLGARPLVSDFLSGISFLFEDTFDFGEKVQLQMGGNSVEGIIEEVNLRATLLRAPTGELFTVPNGEIRIVRNFSRGLFSMVNVRLKIPASQLGMTITLLEELAAEAVSLLPNLLEPWQIINDSGVMGQQTELLLIAKARFGNAAEMLPRLLNLIHERLETKGIHLAE